MPENQSPDASSRLPIGCQVWPLRSMLGDLPAFARMVAQIGVTRLELCCPIGFGSEFASLSDPKAVRTILSDHGLRAESSHFSMGELRNSHEQSIAWAKEIGITQMITATLGKTGDQPTLDEVKRAADEYNRIAAVSAKAGLQQGLHNEDFEHAMVDGKRVLRPALRPARPGAGQVPVPDVGDQGRSRRRRLFPRAPGPLLLDASPRRGFERPA